MYGSLFQFGVFTFSAYALLLIVASVAAGTLAIVVVLRERGSSTSWWFFALGGTMSWWLFCRAMTTTSPDADLALQWARWSYLTFPFLPSATLQFAYEAVGRERKPLRFLIASWWISAAFAILSLTTNAIIAGVLQYPWGFYPKYGNAGVLFILFFLMTGGGSIAVFRSAIRGLPQGRRRKRLTQFAAGFLFGFIGAIDFLAAYGIPVVPFGHLVALGSILIVGSAIRRFQLFDITPAFAATNIISTIQDALLVADDEGRIRIVNDALQMMTGFSREELLGTRLDDLVTNPPQGDSMLRSRSGDPIPVSVSVSTLHDRGQPVGTVVIGHDLRERRRIESVLHEREMLLRTEQVRRTAELKYFTLIENLREGIVQVDSDDIVRYLNDPAAEMIDCTREAAIGQPIAALTNGALAGLHTQSFARRAVEWIANDGRTRWIEITRSPMVEATGESLGTIGVLTDITDRRTFERQLAARAREWQETFDAIQMPLVLLDGEGIVVRANRAALDHSGRSHDDALGIAVGTLGPGTLWREIERAVRSAKQSSRIEFEERDTGSTWDIVIDLIAVEGRRHLVVAARDITSFVELQRTLRHAETMSAVGALIGGVAHEVRNPLFAISSTIDAFEDVESGRRRELVVVLREQIARLSELMYGLLDFGKPGPAMLTPTKPGPNIEQAIDVCSAEARARGVTIDYRPGTAAMLIEADETRLRQALRNIILNAVQSSPRGGIVTVRTESAETAGGSRFRCSISDEGAGFDPPDVARAFEPFFTRRTGGTGLGLSIARAIIDQHHGTVSIANNPKRGAIVTMELPLSA